MMKKNLAGAKNSMANKIRGIIWDLDGVVIDSAEAHLKSWQKMAQEEGLPFTEEQFWATFGWRNDTIIPKLWGAMPDERVRELANRKEAYFREFVREIARPLSGSMELMSA